MNLPQIGSGQLRHHRLRPADNAFAYRNSSDFKAAVAALDAKQKFIKPHCPWQNGKVCEYRSWCWTVLA